MEANKLSVKAFAIACAILWAGTVLIMQIAHIIWPNYGGAFLDLVKSIYPLFNAGPTLRSVAYGTGCAVIDAGIGGLIFAWIYNLALGCKCCCKKEG